VCVFVCYQELHWTPFHLKFVFSVGAVLWILSSIAFLLLPQSLDSLIYVLSLFIGIGNAFMLVTATSMEGILVSKNLSGCGFVYGSLSFLDKLACGIALYSIEGMNGMEKKPLNHVIKKFMSFLVPKDSWLSVLVNECTHCIFPIRLQDQGSFCIVLG
jgi:hypothetical protein